MREILFKAKRIDNGEWVEGYYMFYDNDHIIITINEKGLLYERVRPDTICQYTGLKDKKRKRIWENDIIGFLDVSQYDNGYSEHYCVGQVLWDEETLSFEVTERISCESYEALDGDCEVIGNIFDNPELLGV